MIDIPPVSDSEESAVVILPSGISNDCGAHSASRTGLIWMRLCSSLKVLVVAIAFAGCERQKSHALNNTPGEAVKSINFSLAELRKRTDDLYKRAGADEDVYDSKEWSEVMGAHGPAYKRQLIECIRDAESITITEHSDQVDFQRSRQPLPDPVPFYEYQTVRLTNDQKVAFLRAVEAMDASTEQGAKRCGFEAHHRLDIVRRDRGPTTFSICFKCGDVIWNEGEFTEPKGLMSVLRSVVEASGLEPERDWRALAKARSEQTAPSDEGKTSD